MSCHDIGRGMATVVDQIIELFRNKQIDAVSARKLIKTCMNGVNWCDGNEHEAIQTIIDNTCSCCLTLLKPEEDILYGISYLPCPNTDSNNPSSRYQYFNDMDEVAGYYVCEVCLEKLIKSNDIPLSLTEAKEKCKKQEVTYYFKLRDLFDLQFGRKTLKQACKEYGYKYEQL